MRTRGLLEGMRKLGYRVVNVGEREISNGYDDFVRKTSGVDLSFVSANIVRQDTQAQVFRPYTIVELKPKHGKKIRVAVTGVARYVAGWEKPGPEGAKLSILRPADPIKALLPAMKKVSDVVVVLTALAKPEAQQLVTEVPGIDFVIGAYGGAYNWNEESVAGTRIFYSGNQGKRLGETRVFLGPQRKLDATTSYMHLLTDQYGNDPEMVAFVQRLTEEINKAKGVPAAVPAPPPSAGH